MSLPFLDPTIPNIFECGFDFAKIFYRKIGLRAAYQLVEPERRLHPTQKITVQKSNTVRQPRAAENS